jgi:hypothetical protein
MKKWLVLLSGILAFLIPTYFAWTVYQQNTPLNIATWLMVLLLDGLGLFLSIKDGNKRPYIQIGWTMAALCIVLAITVNNNPWHWGTMETVSLMLCMIAIVLWRTLSARTALWAYMGAFYISFFPQIVDYWYSPQPDTLWLWLWTVGTCALAIIGAEKRNFTNTFVPWGGLALNGLIAVLCIL